MTSACEVYFKIFVKIYGDHRVDFYETTVKSFFFVKEFLYTLYQATDELDTKGVLSTTPTLTFKNLHFCDIPRAAIVSLSIFQVETDRTSNTNYAWFVTGSTPLFDHNGYCHFWESITINCREGRVSVNFEFFFNFGKHPAKSQITRSQTTFCRLISICEQPPLAAATYGHGAQKSLLLQSTLLRGAKSEFGSGDFDKSSTLVG